MSDQGADGERGGTSSITSVTEEDTSVDSESDTTESTSSIITPSVVSSTDTDDKLTPCLVNISISSPAAGTKQRKPHPQPQQQRRDNTRPSPFQFPPFPYGSNPLPLHQKPPDEFPSRRRGRLKQQQAGLLQRVLRGASGHYFGHHQPPLPMNSPHAVFAKENLGATDADDRLSTDFSDTSSKGFVGENEEMGGNEGDLGPDDGDLNVNNSADTGGTPRYDEMGEEDGERGPGFARDEDRPDFPDMTSSAWYRARCFDHYWRHYSFVMEWYQQHVKAVTALSQQYRPPGWGDTLPYQNGAFDTPRSHSRSSSRRRQIRRSKRARKRKKAKERLKLANAASAPVSLGGEEKGAEVDGDEQSDVEMEITDEMFEFFATSLKHRMERDKVQEASGEKESQEHRLNIEDAKTGQSGPTSAAPHERPGVRRTQEMRELYGTGAPMIHGMETALQMSFDRISDRFQPKLWPNMPLKIVFKN